MAYKLADGTGIPIDVPFSIGEINYPANWLRLATADEIKDAGITEYADAKTYDNRFYKTDGTPKPLDDSNAVDGETGELIKDDNGNQVINRGVKSTLIGQDKATCESLLRPYDWYIIRKTEKGTAIPTNISTFRDAVRTAQATREAEINACADTAALVTLYGATLDSEGNFVKHNMTQYPQFP